LIFFDKLRKTSFLFRTIVSEHFYFFFSRFLLSLTLADSRIYEKIVFKQSISKFLTLWKTTAIIVLNMKLTSSWIVQ